MVNIYFITKEIKNAGTDLRFRIKLQHKYQADVTSYGTSYFSLILNSPDRGVIREWKGPYANNSISNPTTFGSIAQYEIQTLNLDLIISAIDALGSEGGWSAISTWQQQDLIDLTHRRAPRTDMMIEPMDKTRVTGSLDIKSKLKV